MLLSSIEKRLSEKKLYSRLKEAKMHKEKRRKED